MLVNTGTWTDVEKFACYPRRKRLCDGITILRGRCGIWLTGRVAGWLGLPAKLACDDYEALQSGPNTDASCIGRPM